MSCNIYVGDLKSKRWSPLGRKCKRSSRELTSTIFYKTKFKTRLTRETILNGPKIKDVIRFETRL